MSTDELLDAFTNTIATTLLGVSEEPGFSVYPMPKFHPSEGCFYLYIPFLKSVHEQLAELTRKGLSDGEAARLFKNPSRIANLTYNFEGIRLGVQQGAYTKDDGIGLATRLLRYIGHLRADIFCQGNRNIIWAQDKVNNMTKGAPMMNLASLSQYEQARVRKCMGRINALLFNLCELLYFAHHAIGHEFHGPYALTKRRKLVVREYYDLKNEFWNFTRSLPCDKITTMEIYEDVDIYFDFFNRCRSTESLPSRLVGLCARMGGFDGKPMDNIEKLEQLYNDFLPVVTAGTNYVRQLSRRDLFKKWVEVHFSTLEPIAERLGTNWHPPESVYKMIDETDPPMELVEAFKKMSTIPREQQMAILKRIFDPRIDRPF